MMERIEKIRHAMALITKLNSDLMVMDYNLGRMVSAQEIYEMYLQDVSVRELVDVMEAAVRTNNEIMDRVDAERKLLTRMLIQQPENHPEDDLPCIYVELKDAPELVGTMANELDISDPLQEFTSEMYLGIFDGKHYFLVESLVKPFSIEDWKGTRPS